MEVLSADQLEAIHFTSLRILEELGMEVMSPRALARLHTEREIQWARSELARIEPLLTQQQNPRV